MDGVDGFGLGLGDLDDFLADGGVEGQADGAAVGIEQADDLGFLFEEIYAEVGIALKDAHFAHLLEGDAAGCEVGHAAVFELQAGVADVGRMADDGHAVGSYFPQGGAHQKMHDIEVVDHEVQDDGDICAAGIETGEAMGFYEAWIYLFLF